MTVQNDRAYYVGITTINDLTLQEQAPKLEQVLSTVSYQQPDPAKFANTQMSARVTLAAALPTDNIKTPAGSIDDDTLYNIVAKDQPAVVRIGALRCGTVVIQFPDSSTAQLTNVCNGGIGSGSFISSNGYIATNGHVTRVLRSDMVTAYLVQATSLEQVKQRAAELLGYLVKLGVMDDSQKAAFVDAVKNGDQQAVQALNALGQAFPVDALTVKDDTYHYTVQTSNDPIHAKTDLSDFTYTKTVIPATFIAANYFEDSTAASTSPQMYASGKSDVSILKVEGTNYPVVTLGSIDDVREGDALVAIGFPAFIDNGIRTTQKYTIPSATAGRVLSVGSDISLGGTGLKLIATTVPIAHGNSSGPAFDQQGSVVGLNTYGSITCPDQKCFGNGIVRDIADIKKLAADNHVTISSSSSTTDEWNNGLQEFRTGDFGGAATSFDKERQLYPANYLAAQLGDIASENAPSLFRISQDDIPRITIFYAILAVAWAVIGCIVAAIAHIVHGSRRQSHV